MAYSLLENLHNLPGKEIDRLQKRLGIILRNSSETERLRTSVYGIFTRMGDPVLHHEKLNKSTRAGESLFRLMDAFGSMHISHLESDELAELKLSPYTVWPDENNCMLSEEAMDVFTHSFESLPSEYLFKHIRGLSVREKKSWARWIKLNFVSTNERMRNRVLYRKLAKLCYEKCSDSLDIQSLYLEDVFPDDPGRFSVAWFYRDVLSLYDSLHKMESENTDLDSNQKKYLNLLKIGKLLVVREKAEFGSPSKHRLILSRESHLKRVKQEPIIDEPEDMSSTLESSLF